MRTGLYHLGCSTVAVNSIPAGYHESVLIAIILPIPPDLFRPYLSGPNGHGASAKRSEEEEAERT